MKIGFAVLTVSDRSSQGLRTDLSGPKLKELITNAGWDIVESAVVPDEYEQIQTNLLQWCENPLIDIILSTGGTGFAPRDITPEATKALVEREAPGLCEAMRIASMKITPYAMLSRSFAGIRGQTLIINLPGSPKAVEENFLVIQDVFPHAVSLLREDPHAEQDHERNG